MFEYKTQRAVPLRRTARKRRPTERRIIMNSALGAIILCEILLTLAIVYGMLHEQALIRFERAAAARIRTALTRKKQQKARRDREKFNARVAYTPVKPGAVSSGSSREAA